MRAFIRIVYRFVLRPIFFVQDPERVHNRFLWFGGFLGRYKLTRAFTGWLFDYRNRMLRQRVVGLDFINPVGLSAGFDKDADLIEILPHVGFGFTQAGTVTLKPYGGNPPPRLYRLVKTKGLVVYSGLKNIGIERVIERMKGVKPKHFPISISIGKTNCRDTHSTSGGIEDYYKCFERVIESGIGDFYTINISCPNTFGGEPFTSSKKLYELLEKFQDLKIDKPVFLKMPTDLKWPDYEKLLELAIKHKIDGVVIGNLSKNRKDELIKDKIPAHIKGSISGPPTRMICDELISRTYENYGKRLKIIGVGGISSAHDAYDKIKRGACLLQLITGMIFEGPQLIGEINKGLVKLLKRDGYKSIEDAVGAYHSSV